MRARFCVVAIVLSCLARPVSAGPATQHCPTLSIRIHDYANVDRREMQRVQQQVSEMYAQTGVHLEWLTVAHPVQALAGRASWPVDGEPQLTVIVLGRGMAAPPGIAKEVAGYAPITREHGGRVAFAFGDRAAAIAERAATSPSTVLSAVIAHEIAHLLMPQRSHSADGLMHAEWAPDQFRWAARWRFSSEESRDIRDMAGVLAGRAQRVAD